MGVVSHHIGCGDISHKHTTNSDTNKTMKSFRELREAGPGMWMPKQKDGKNWIVEYEVTVSGKVHNQSRKFRVKSDAQRFITSSKKTFKDDARVTKYSFVIKPYKKET